MRKVMWLLYFLALAAGAVADVIWLLIGGIEQLIRGVQEHPVSGHDIAIGVVRLLLSFGGASGFFLLLTAGLAAIAAKSVEPPKRNRYDTPPRLRKY